MLTSLDAYVFSRTRLSNPYTKLRVSEQVSEKQSSNKPISVCLVGNKSAGKTALTKRLATSGRFEKTIPTVGGETRTIICSRSNGHRLVLCVKDTSGNPDYHSLLPSFYRGTEVAVLVYDITNHDSFDSVFRWATNIQNYESFFLHTFILCGTKLDLVHKDSTLRQVTPEEAERMAATLGCSAHFETSAKSGEQIQALRNEIGGSVTKRRTNSLHSVDKETASITDDRRVTKDCCCCL